MNPLTYLTRKREAFQAMPMTDQVRDSVRRMFIYATMVGLILLMLSGLGYEPDKDMFKMIFTALVGALAIGEGSNGVKRATAKQEVIVADAEADRIRNGGGGE
jgi:hypothetical protein